MHDFAFSVIADLAHNGCSASGDRPLMGPRWLESAVEIFASPFRYVWPAELDLMARLAGMMLRERWGGWEREPFAGHSTTHVSVWEKTP